MECSFEERKRDLENECRLPTNAMASYASRLDKFMKPFLISFQRHEQRTHAKTFVCGLGSDLERKNAESIAYLFGLDRKVIQHFIGGSEWNDAPLRDELARQIGSQLGEEDGVLVFVEVKTRRSRDDGANQSHVGFEAVGGLKQNKIVSAALRYLARNDLTLSDVACRFDVIVVHHSTDAGAAEPEVLHVRDAFHRMGWS